MKMKIIRTVDLLEKYYPNDMQLIESDILDVIPSGSEQKMLLETSAN